MGNPFAEAPWTVMIQTEYHDEPPGIAELRETFWKTSIIALAVVGIALPLLWTWVLRTLRRQE